VAARRGGWCVYVLRCGDGSLYTGATNDLLRRVERHARGKGGRYTRSRLPIVLVHSERAAGRGPALRREAALKRLSRAAKLALVRGAKPRATRPLPSPDQRPAGGARGGKAPAATAPAPAPARGRRRTRAREHASDERQRLAATAAASSGKSFARMKRVPSGIG
jgi:putative endonuclease